MNKNDFYKFRWSFGNHEPVSMYRRIGNKSTAGIEGSALWLEKWHNWFDSEDCVKNIAELGLNILHCRFYKGMGWEFEKEDFSRVKAFTALCHHHGIKVLAYVQYSTLYYEIMKNEIPNLENWAAIDSHGEKICYHGNSYYRWMPCINSSDWLAYLKNIIAIGIREANFDGIFFDNYFAANCCCPRCLELFQNYLRDNCNIDDFGLPSFDHVECPPESVTQLAELKDPLVIAWLRFRNQSQRKVLRHLYDFIKSLNPELIVTGNTGNIRGDNDFRKMGLGLETYRTCFDIILSQSGNSPCCKDGMIINRVREMMFAEAMGKAILPLADSDAGLGSTQENVYISDWMETAIWGGITIDRTVMAPLRGGAFNEQIFKEHKDNIDRFRKIISKYIKYFQSKNCATGVFYSQASQQLSANARNTLFSTEELLLRHHIPFRLIIGNGREIIDLEQCEMLIVIGQSCLSEMEVAAIKTFVSSGGKVLFDAVTGDNNENNQQRAFNPFVALADGISYIQVSEFENRIIDGNWQQHILAPKKTEKLLEKIEKALDMSFSIDAPEEVFSKVVKTSHETVFHFLNYAEDECKNAIVLFKNQPKQIRIATFANPELSELSCLADNVKIPPFASWAMLIVSN